MWKTCTIVEKIEHDWTAVKSSEILRNTCYRILNQFTILVISFSIRGWSLKNQLLKKFQVIVQRSFKNQGTPVPQRPRSLFPEWIFNESVFDELEFMCSFLTVPRKSSQWLVIIYFIRSNNLTFLSYLHYIKEYPASYYISKFKTEQKNRIIL